MSAPALLLPVAVLFPMVSGGVLLVLRPKRAGFPAAWCFGTSLLTSALVWFLIVCPPEESIKLVDFTGTLDISLFADGVGRVFGAIVASLWPLAALYAWEYMSHDSRKRSFFGLYTVCLGVTLGVCFAQNLLTMYLFYELLTLGTVPLVLHPLTRRAVHAARKYMYFSFGGTAFAFISLIVLNTFGNGSGFTGGGILTGHGRPGFLLLVWFLGFMGFGVKAAVFPVHSWLPDASVAPTPVTALLHAVAVVKSGVFAIVRLTFFCFGADFIRGTWAHTAATAIVCFTALFGSVMAVREPHFKKRMAYSTVANLSYILIGVMLLTPQGLTAGLWHTVSHALMKICVFFCAGAVIHRTGKEYIWELGGAGRSMPVTMACFAVCSAALTGLPPFSGFSSKLSLITAGISSGTVWGMIGAGVLLVCGLLTAIYMFSVVTRAYFPRRDGELLPPDVGDGGIRMTLPIVLTSSAVILFGLWTEPVIRFISGVGAF